MPASKLTCPDCGKVLRPAKPLPAGKKVKCPECGALFVAVDDEVPKATIAAVAKRGAKADAGKAKAPKKSGPAPAEKPKAPDGTIPFADDEDDGPATYSFEAGAKHEEPEIDHVPDTSIKDLRGPAQEAVMRPSNYLILCGVLGALSYLIMLGIILIPVMFPVPEHVEPTEGTGAAAPAAPEKKAEKKKENSLFTMFSWDLMDIASYRWWVIMLLALVCVFGMVYCGVATYGAVRMQTLESRVWGFVSSIMALMPAQALGVFCLLSIPFTFVSDLLFDEGGLLLIRGILWGILIFGASIGIGIWGIMTLLREDVVAGYEYVEE